MIYLYQKRNVGILTYSHTTIVEAGQISIVSYPEEVGGRDYLVGHSVTITIFREKVCAEFHLTVAV